MWSAVSASLGLGLVVVTGWRLIDPIVAACVAIYILWVGGARVLQPHSLLDEAAPADVQVQIKSSYIPREGALEPMIPYPYLGPLTFIEFHLIVPGKT